MPDFSWGGGTRSMVPVMNAPSVARVNDSLDGPAVTGPLARPRKI